jgi:hypothetical protein
MKDAADLKSDFDFPSSLAVALYIINLNINQRKTCVAFHCFPRELKILGDKRKPSGGPIIKEKKNN